MLGHIELHTNCLVGGGEIMACLKYDLNDQRVQYLISTDEVLGKLIRYIGTSELVIEEDGFKCNRLATRPVRLYGRGFVVWLVQ